MPLQKDLREFIELLSSHEVEYLVVGGHAVAYHGYPRYTGDIDFFINPTPANAAKLVDALADFGFGALGLDVATFTKADTVVQLGTPPHRIDLLTSISGVSFDRAWQGRAAGDLDGMPVLFIGRAELIENKRATGRPKDIADLDEIGS